MQLSSEARKAGRTALMQGPREDVKAADLEPYLRSEFFGGRSIWRLFEPLLGLLYSSCLLALECVNGSFTLARQK